MKKIKIDFNTVIKDEKELQKQCYIDGDYIILNVRYPYEIHLNRCNTYRDIIEWAIHLSSKNWVNKKLLSRFLSITKGRLDKLIDIN